MIYAGSEEILSARSFVMILLAVLIAAALIIAARIRRLRRRTGMAQPMSPAPVTPAPVGVEIPYSVFVAMEADLEAGPIGDGLDRMGRSFAIRRYRSRETGKLYDCVTTAGETEPRVLEYPPPTPS